MSEVNKRICKGCKLIKDRISDGTFKNTKNRKWRDESGGLWNGSVCSVCNTNRLKDHMKSKRAKASNEVL